MDHPLRRSDSKFLHVAARRRGFLLFLILQHHLASQLRLTGTLVRARKLKVDTPILVDAQGSGQVRNRIGLLVREHQRPA